MTREELKKAMPILTAFVDGKTIQNYLRGSGKWIAVGEHLDMSDLFAWPSDYRSKPEPKYRPFKDAEECWNEMQKHQPFGWIKSKNDSTINKFMFIDSLRKDEVSISNVDFNYNDLVEYYIFADGTPFGIKEE